MASRRVGPVMVLPRFETRPSCAPRPEVGFCTWAVAALWLHAMRKAIPARKPRMPVEGTKRFFKHRAGKAKPSDLLGFLDRAPAKPPVRGDEKG